MEAVNDTRGYDDIKKSSNINSYQFSYRSSGEGLKVFSLLPTLEEHQVWHRPDVHFFSYSPCGEYIAMVVGEPDVKNSRIQQQQVVTAGLPQLSVGYLHPSAPRVLELVKTSNFETLHCLDDVDGLEAHFYWSPNSDFLVTWQPLQQVNGGDRALGFCNFKVWNVITGKLVLAWRYQQRQCWPMLRWTPDQRMAVLWVQGQLQLFKWPDFGHDHHWNDHLKKLTMETLNANGIEDWTLTKSALAIYLPPRNDQPARVNIYSLYHQRSDGCNDGTNATTRYEKKTEEYSNTNNDNVSSLLASPNPISSKSFFQVDDVRLMWHHRDKALLVFATTQMDQTGQMYYGHTGLYYLSLDGKHNATVVLDRPGPIHDVQWNSNGNDFAVTYGFMPSKTTLFNKKCKPLGNLGSESRNTLLWNPSGRLLCLGGFGQLPGELDFWDTLKLRKIGSNVAYCSGYHEWSPDGRYLLAAATWPRMRVDNNFKVFDVAGNCICAKEITQLSKIQWQPRPGSTVTYPCTNEDIVVDEPKHIVSTVRNISRIGRQGDNADQHRGDAPLAGHTNPAQIHALGVYRPPHLSKNVYLNSRLNSKTQEGSSIIGSQPQPPVRKSRIPIGGKPKVHPKTKPVTTIPIVPQ